MTMQTRRRVGQIALFMVTIVVAILFFFPIFFNLMSAFKSNAGIMKDAIERRNTSWTRFMFVYFWPE
ncbi:ABC-type glycerol-3-phosphate transport system permease component [Paenibacillus sp. PastF-3]|jgi:raffinose/stachyose/melibiose transport system permease protein|uniref:hypothetical protein n=1 Tax=Paenibacillus TaxID=44249 RepID=UPI002473FB7B|nr:hypothetical protein [Paenibacillus sp. PastF-3]MDH6374746.1 ABC-type glycerol-3-phosphate transport system permease component [Paenibacillus sp. PastF-3]